MPRIVVLSLLLALTWGCSAAPRQELQTARMAVARAEHAGARELVPEDFGRADAVLREGEALVRSGEYDRARQLLPKAAALARQADVLAREERAHRERERLAAAAAAAAAAAERQKIAARQPTPPVPSPPKKTPTPAPAPSPPPPLTDYPVGESETLWTIAARQEVYGDPLLWPILYQANRDQIKDPRQVYPGQVLTIPRGLSAGDLDEAREKARRSDIFPSGSPSRSHPSPPPQEPGAEAE